MTVQTGGTSTLSPLVVFTLQLGTFSGHIVLALLLSVWHQLLTRPWDGEVTEWLSL